MILRIYLHVLQKSSTVQYHEKIGLICICQKTQSYIFLVHPSILLYLLLILDNWNLGHKSFEKSEKLFFLISTPPILNCQKCLNWQRIHLASGNRIKQELLHCLLSELAFIVTTYSLSWAGQTLIYELRRQDEGEKESNAIQPS